MARGDLPLLPSQSWTLRRSNHPSSAAPGTTVDSARNGISTTATPAVDDELDRATTKAATSTAIAAIAAATNTQRTPMNRASPASAT
jgi:hypothetical protein